MRKTFISFMLVVMMLALVVASVGAITFGEPDGNDHPYVGTLLFVQNGVGYYSCTGTLLSPTVMLTAGHCTEEYGNVNDETWVRFDEDAYAGYKEAKSTKQWLRQNWIEAKEVIPHPMYDDFSGFPNTYDMGLVILKQPVHMAKYGKLPEIGLLDKVINNEKPNSFTPVGYGMQGYINPFYQDDYARYQATTKLINLNDYNTGDGQGAKFTNNPGGGTGGTCYGDSGGPVFYNDSNVVSAIVSWGISPCIGVDYQFRIDTEVAQDFINEHLN